MDLNSTSAGTLLEGFYPAGWDLPRIDQLCARPPEVLRDRQPHWHPDFRPVPCDSLADFAVLMGHEIALEIRTTGERGVPLALILPVGPMGMYRWVVHFLRAWGVGMGHVTCFNMDEWADADGDTLAPDDPGSFHRAMTDALYTPLGDLANPPEQRNFATRENLPTYAEKIEAIRAAGGRLVTVYGIGRMCHIAFWEPQYAADYPTEAEWRAATHRLGARLHPLTIEQNAITSFRSRSTLVPATANTIGPGLFLRSDRMIGGADGALGRGMQWQGMSLRMTLLHEPTPWITSTYVPTLPGTLFYLAELAGPLEPDAN